MCRTRRSSALWRRRAERSWTIVPTLLHENGAWRARAEVQDASTGSTVTQLETEAVASSLTKDAAYSRIVALADLIERHFARGGGPLPSTRPLSARLRTLDAVQALESGLMAMERMEYARGARSVCAALPRSMAGIRCRRRG